MGVRRSRYHRQRHRQQLEGTAARHLGRGCSVGGGEGEVTLEVSDDLLRRQITLHGSWSFSTARIAACTHYVAEHDVDMDLVFSHMWSLDDAGEALRPCNAQVGAKATMPRTVGRRAQNPSVRSFLRRIQVAPLPDRRRPGCRHPPRICSTRHRRTSGWRGSRAGGCCRHRGRRAGSGSSP